MNDEPLKPLEYADPHVESARPLSGRKETIELFREPPAVARWSLSDIVIWVVSFLVVLAVFLWLVSRWLGGIK